MAVMALLTGGGYAEFVEAYHGCVMPIPHTLSLRSAAAVPEAYLTAFQLLQLAKVARGDVVLVHAGASSVGTAATQLAKQLGATVIVTAGSADKLEYARQQGADLAINYNDLSTLPALASGAAGAGAGAAGAGAAAAGAATSATAVQPQQPRGFAAPVRQFLSSLKSPRAGVDVVLDCVGASHFWANFDSIAGTGTVRGEGSLTGARQHRTRNKTSKI